MLNPIFYNLQRDGYEELVSYGPYFYKDILEMDANYRFAGKTLDIMAVGLEEIISNQFIDYANEEMIGRLEKWLGIDIDTGRSLEDRRKRVRLVWSGGEKLSGSFIKSLVRSYTGCDDDPTVKMTTFLTINAYLSSTKAVYLADLMEQLEKMKPAHIRMEMSLVNYSKIRIGSKVKHSVYSYDKAGEKPDVATLGAALHSKVLVNSELSDKVYGHQPASETMEVGTFPNVGTVGSAVEHTIYVTSQVSDTLYTHQEASEIAEAGLYPDVSTVGSLLENGISTGDTMTVSLSSYVECGTNLCGEEGL